MATYFVFTNDTTYFKHSITVGKKKNVWEIIISSFGNDKRIDTNIALNVGRRFRKWAIYPGDLAILVVGF